MTTFVVALPVSPSPVNVSTKQTAMSSRTVLQTSRRGAIERLLARAALMNRLAKLATTAHARGLLYAQKTAAVVRLIECGAGQIEELLLTRELVTVKLCNG